MENVRTALSGDMERCVALLNMAVKDTVDLRGGNEFLGLGPGYAPSVDGATVEDWAIQNKDRVLIVGLFEDEIVGVCAGEMRTHPLSTTQKIATINICYVEEEARGVGVGSALVKEILAWFQKHGCSDIDARALPGDRSTKQLYENSGFKARLLTLHRQI